MRMPSSCPVISAGAALYMGATMCAVANDERALREAIAIVQLLRAGSNGMVPRRRFDYEDVFGAHPSSVATPKSPSSVTSNTYSQLPKNDTQSTQSSHDSITPLSSTELPRSASSLQPTVSTKPLSSTKSSPQANSNQNRSNLKFTTSRSSAPSKHSESIKLTSRAASHLDSSQDPYPPSDSINKDTLAQFQSTHSLVTPWTSAHTHKLEVTSEPSKKLGLKKDSTTNRPNIAPELQQVAMELAGELEASEAGGHRHSVRTPPRPAMTSTRPTARVTWREYLARSTRYPVPLPENHAFCYTDPRNALCRTFI